MKRWRDVQFLKGGPLSIAITVAAYKWFQPKKAVTGTYLDLEALLAFVDAMRAAVTWKTTDEGLHQRLGVELLVTPYGDLTAKMSKDADGEFPGGAEEPARRPRQGVQRTPA